MVVSLKLSFFWQERGTVVRINFFRENIIIFPQIYSVRETAIPAQITLKFTNFITLICLETVIYGPKLYFSW